jgi:DNA-binding beta-propeller fold protein YncE
MNELSSRLGRLVAAITLAAMAAAGIAHGAPQQRSYTFYVAAESDDVVEKITFADGELRLDKSIPVGIWPTETEGPHGLTISPDGEYWFVTIAHGNPFGTLYKYDAATDTYVDEVRLGLFPATMSVSPSTGLLFAVNFNLHGDHVPSTISVVEIESMSEVAQIPTGVMPHGSRMNRAGSRQYSVAMMSDELREVDAYRLETRRVLPLSDSAPSWMHYQHTGNGLMSMDHGSAEGETGHGGGMEHEDDTHQGAEMAMDHDAHHAMKPPQVKPTWVTQVTPQGKVYVAGNGNATLYEVDVEGWAVARTFGPTGAGPYNLDVTPDGKILVATYKGDRGIGVWSTETGEELARVPTLRPVPHGVVVTPDGRYAFVSIEGIGGEPGSVEAIDLQSFQRVANLDIAKQAGGIALWRAE